MSESRIVLFTQQDCLPCQWVKKFLEEQGVAFEVRDVTTDTSAAEEMEAKYRSHSTPTLVVGDEVLIGFDPERIRKILGN